MAIQSFIKHLKTEASVYEDLIALLRVETENLVNRDYRGLYETVTRKEHLLMKIDSLGDLRATHLNNAAASLGVYGFVNLSAIIEFMNGDEREELNRCRSSILALIHTIKEINKVNETAVKGSLHNMKKTLKLLGTLGTEPVKMPRP